MPCETIYFSLAAPQEPTTVPPIEFRPQVGQASVAVSHQPALSQADAFNLIAGGTILLIFWLVMAAIFVGVVAALWALASAVWSGLCHAAGALGMADTADGARQSMDQQSASYLRSVTRTLFGR